MKTSVPASISASNGGQNSSRDSLTNTDSSQPRSKNTDLKLQSTISSSTCPVKDTDLQEITVWLERDDDKSLLTWKMLTYGSVTNGREFAALNPNQMELNVLAGGKDTNSLVQTLPASAPAYLIIQSGLKKVLIYWTPEAVPLPPRIYKKLLQDRSWLESNLPGVDLNFSIKDEKDLMSLITTKIATKTSPGTGVKNRVDAFMEASKNAMSNVPKPKTMQEINSISPAYATSNPSQTGSGAIGGILKNKSRDNIGTPPSTSPSPPPPVVNQTSEEKPGLSAPNRRVSISSVALFGDPQNPQLKHLSDKESDASSQESSQNQINETRNAAGGMVQRRGSFKNNQSNQSPDAPSSPSAAKANGGLTVASRKVSVSWNVLPGNEQNKNTSNQDNGLKSADHSINELTQGLPARPRVSSGSNGSTGLHKEVSFSVLPSNAADEATAVPPSILGNSTISVGSSSNSRASLGSGQHVGPGILKNTSPPGSSSIHHADLVEDKNDSSSVGSHGKISSTHSSNTPVTFDASVPISPTSRPKLTKRSTMDSSHAFSKSSVDSARQSILTKHSTFDSKPKTDFNKIDAYGSKTISHEFKLLNGIGAISLNIFDESSSVPPIQEIIPLKMTVEETSASKSKLGSADLFEMVTPPTGLQNFTQDGNVDKIPGDDEEEEESDDQRNESEDDDDREEEQRAFAQLHNPTNRRSSSPGSGAMTPEKASSIRGSLERIHQQGSNSGSRRASFSVVGPISADRRPSLTPHSTFGGGPDRLHTQLVPGMTLERAASIRGSLEKLVDSARNSASQLNNGVEGNNIKIGDDDDDDDEDEQPFKNEGDEDDDDDDDDDDEIQKVSVTVNSNPLTRKTSISPTEPNRRLSVSGMSLERAASIRGSLEKISSSSRKASISIKNETSPPARSDSLSPGMSIVRAASITDSLEKVDKSGTGGGLAAGIDGDSDDEYDNDKAKRQPEETSKMITLGNSAGMTLVKAASILGSLEKLHSHEGSQIISVEPSHGTLRTNSTFSGRSSSPGTGETTGFLHASYSYSSRSNTALTPAPTRDDDNILMTKLKPSGGSSGSRRGSMVSIAPEPPIIIGNSKETTLTSNVSFSVRPDVGEVIKDSLGPTTNKVVGTKSKSPGYEKFQETFLDDEFQKLQDSVSASPFSSSPPESPNERASMATANTLLVKAESYKSRVSHGNHRVSFHDLSSEPAAEMLEAQANLEKQKDLLKKQQETLNKLKKP